MFDQCVYYVPTLTARWKVIHCLAKGIVSWWTALKTNPVWLLDEEKRACPLPGPLPRPWTWTSTQSLGGTRTRGAWTWWWHFCLALEWFIIQIEPYWAPIVASSLILNHSQCQDPQPCHGDSHTEVKVTGHGHIHKWSRSQVTVTFISDRTHSYESLYAPS